jgi:hypothetical protein
MMYIKLHSPFSLAADFADVSCLFFSFVASGFETLWPTTYHEQLTATLFALLFTSHQAPLFSLQASSKTIFKA